MKRINNAAYKTEVIEAIHNGLEKEGFKDTPHNAHLLEWSQEHKCVLLKAEGGEAHAGHVVGIETTYGQLVGMYEW